MFLFFVDIFWPYFLPFRTFPLNNREKPTAL